ncbi:MAG TPA: hypothetical protein VFB34_00220 [Chloroflexota bacterium]|nr:hypothetical protein [Chloroflexota bacterium]
MDGQQTQVTAGAAGQDAVASRGSPAAHGRTECIIRRLTNIVWILLGAIEVVLLLRITAMLLVGQEADGSAGQGVVALLYDLTQFVVAPLQPAANVSTTGTKHALDVAPLLSMEALFLIWLGLSKVLLAVGRRADAPTRSPHY